MSAEHDLMNPAAAIVIAAGGDGKRMGGSKASRLLGGRRLIDHALEWAMHRSDAVALAVRHNDPDWDTGLPLLLDRHPGIGPITALASAFRFTQQERRPSVLMIGCDMPFLPNNLLEKLELTLPGHGAAMPVSSGRRHPMATLWVPDVAALEGYMATGGQSLWGFAQSIGTAELAWDDALDPFRNINYLADLTEAEQVLKRPMP